MDTSLAVWLVTLTAVAAANAPYLSERPLWFGPRRGAKSGWWRLLELALMAVVTWAVGTALEVRIGQRAPQGWEFYAAGLCLFVTLGFPGFVWRYLRRRAADVDG